MYRLNYQTNAEHMSRLAREDGMKLHADPIYRLELPETRPKAIKPRWLWYKPKGDSLGSRR